MPSNKLSQHEMEEVLGQLDRGLVIFGVIRTSSTVFTASGEQLPDETALMLVDLADGERLDLEVDPETADMVEGYFTEQAQALAHKTQAARDEGPAVQTAEVTSLLERLAVAREDENVQAREEPLEGHRQGASSEIQQF